MRFSYLFKQTSYRILFLILLDLISFIFVIWSFKLGDQFAFLKITFTFILLVPVSFTIRQLTDRYIKGEEGEDKVYKVLKELPKDFCFVQDFVKGKKGNVDFVAIGPNGVWVIEAKNYSYISQQILDHATNQTYAEAMEIKKFIINSLNLQIPVHPVLVFTNPKTKLHFGFNTIRGVYVIGINWLMKLLREQNQIHILTQEQCLKVHDELKKYTSII